MVKVECGSQFSVALTKSGAVYTWYVVLQSEGPSHDAAMRGSAECVCFLFIGEKVTTTGWVTALTITCDDPDRFRGYKEKRSLPSPRGLCTVFAAQKTVRRTVLCTIFAFCRS